MQTYICRTDFWSLWMLCWFIPNCEWQFLFIGFDLDQGWVFPLLLPWGHTWILLLKQLNGKLESLQWLWLLCKEWIAMTECKGWLIFVFEVHPTWSCHFLENLQGSCCFAQFLVHTYSCGIRCLCALQKFLVEFCRWHFISLEVKDAALRIRRCEQLWTKNWRRDFFWNNS